MDRPANEASGVILPGNARRITRNYGSYRENRFTMATTIHTAAVKIIVPMMDAFQSIMSLFSSTVTTRPA